MDKTLRLFGWCSNLFISCRIIRHKAVIPENEGRPDKFRIQITDNGQKTVLGTVHSKHNSSTS